MAALLECVLNGEVSPSVLIEWLHDETVGCNYDCLKKHEKLRQEFLPYFLNNVRDQCSWLIRSSRRNSQTPCKLPVHNTLEGETVSAGDESQRANSCGNTCSSKTAVKFRRELKFHGSPASLSSDSSICLSSETSNSDVNKVEKSESPVLSKKCTSNSKSDCYKVSDVLDISTVSSYNSDKKISTVRTNRVPLSGNRGNLTSQLQRKNNQEFLLSEKKPRRIRSRKGGTKLSKNDEISILHKHIPVPDINDLDAFPPVGTQSTGLKPLRRITPTAVVKDTQNTVLPSPINKLLSEDSFSVPRKVWNNVFQSTPLKEPGDVSLQEERELLKKTRNHLLNKSLKNLSKVQNLTSTEVKDDPNGGLDQQSSLSSNAVVITPVKKQESPQEWETPTFNFVNSKNKLNIMVDLFAGCLQSNLIPNMSVELYFIFQLLTSRIKKNYSNKNANAEDIFSSIHNCVYFSTCVLIQQKYLLELFDRSTLKLLLEVPYLADFSSQLIEILTKLYEETTMMPKRKLSCIEGVSFQADTDTSKNFTSIISFHTFRKQRDLFYELFRDWQKHHLTAGWTSKESFVKRVKNLVSLSVDPANYAHLAKLVQSQLITTCCGSNENNDSGDEKALADLKRSFPEKIEKLQERFLTPTRTGGPCPPPSFPGSQSFFHDFLQVAESAALNQHLMDNLSAKIISLNNMEITCDSETSVDNEIQEQFLSALRTLHLLAKFHGYISFFPYHTSGTIPADMIASQRALRNHVSPPLDVYHLLHEAVIKHRLVLTVPWIVEFLSMMDPVAPFLDYFQNVFNLIFKIYRGKYLYNMKPLNVMFIKLILGWLFETPNFPQSLFFIDITRIHDDLNLDRHSTSSDTLDSLSVVDHNIIYLCCPYLGELRIMLEEYLTGIRSKGGEVRKITPVSADDSSSLCIAAKQLEFQLEENFFHLHPSSLKRTVEFVADRIASRAIRFIRNNLVPSSKKSVIEYLKTVVKCPSSNFSVSEEIKKLDPIIADVALKLYNDIKRQAALFLQTFCSQETEKALVLLLSEETEPLVVKMCAQISCRMANDKVFQWTKTHVTVTFTRCDVKAEAEKILKGKDDTSTEILNNKSAINEIYEVKFSTVEIISLLRDCILEVQSRINISQYTTECILNIIEKITYFLHSKQELSPYIIKTTGVLVTDWIIILVVYLPNNCTDEILTSFVQLWERECFQCLSLNNIICARNVQLMSYSPDPHCSWLKLGSLAIKLFESNLLTPQQLEDNILTIIKQEWSKDIQGHLTNCLQRILDSYKQRCPESEFELLDVLDGLSLFCHQEDSPE